MLKDKQFWLREDPDEIWNVTTVKFMFADAALIKNYSFSVLVLRSATESSLIIHFNWFLVMVLCYKPVQWSEFFCELLSINEFQTLTLVTIYWPSGLKSLVWPLITYFCSIKTVTAIIIIDRIFIKIANKVFFSLKKLVGFFCQYFLSA